MDFTLNIQELAATLSIFSISISFIIVILVKAVIGALSYYRIGRFDWHRLVISTLEDLEYLVIILGLYGLYVFIGYEPLALLYMALGAIFIIREVYKWYLAYNIKPTDLIETVQDKLDNATVDEVTDIFEAVLIKKGVRFENDTISYDDTITSDDIELIADEINEESDIYEH